MSYTKIFKEERFEEVRHILEEIVSLEPGERVIISDLTSEGRSRARWLIYDWLHHQGFSQRYSLRNLDSDLSISRKGLGSHTLHREGGLAFSLEEIFKECLLLPSQEGHSVASEEEVYRFLDNKELGIEAKRAIVCKFNKVTR